MESELLVKSKVELDEYDEEDGVVEISPDGQFVRYDEVLGGGSFKVVYKGFDQVNGIEIAWNQISINDDVLLLPAHRERLLAEAALVKSLRHENITKCYCSWVDNENKTINMITELCCSGNLREFRRKHKGVDIKAIKNWARQILKGLCYLHSLNPPIVHRDLKCDNVFVNGNHAEVKIGDLGFATILHEGVARSVIGTPEFMAPEIFEDEYNELVDIYAFGMCMLELVTSECPYSECKNVGHVYKKVISGEKPIALGKVKDPNVKQFIEKCLVPASQRLPAVELLKDPFLSCENSKELLSVPKSVNLPNLDSQTSMEIDPNYPNSSQLSVSVGSCTSETRVWTPELRRWHGGKEFRLRGKKLDDDSISFIFSFTCLQKVKKFEFVFDLHADTTLSMAREMIELELSENKVSILLIEDVAPIADLMDSLLSELAPNFKPSGYSGVKFLHDGSIVLQRDKVEIHGAEELERCGVSVGESAMSSEFTRNLEEVSFVHSYSTVSDYSSLDNSSPIQTDKDELNGLKLELDAIEFQFQQCFRELLRKREEAKENAKKRWMTNLTMSAV
ncbi:hypothetical protein LguiA_034590 [Lonicera macranthoides]